MLGNSSRGNFLRGDLLWGIFLQGNVCSVLTKTPHTFPCMFLLFLMENQGVPWIAIICEFCVGVFKKWPPWGGSNRLPSGVPRPVNSSKVFTSIYILKLVMTDFFKIYEACVSEFPGNFEGYTEKHGCVILHG